MRNGTKSVRGRTALLLLLVAAALLASACAGGSNAYRKGEAFADREMWDEAVLAYAKANAEDPTSTRNQLALLRAKLRASAAHFDRGRQYLEAGQLELAVKELQETVILDPTNEYAQVELKKALDRLEYKRTRPSEYDSAKAAADRQMQELGPPKLDPASNVPLSLKFPDQTIAEVYEILSKTSGINFIFDDKLDLKKKITVELVNVPFEKAMDQLMMMNKHFYKVLDGHTIMIAEDSRQKRQEYEDHVIRTFYLSNAETKEVQGILRSLLEMRRVAESPQLNAITIKDTPEKIKVAERIIRANDKSRGEVVVDIELLEVNRNRTRDLGIDLSSKTLGMIFGDGKALIPLNNLGILNNAALWSLGPIPSVIFSFLKSDSDTKVIAKPQIRILEGEEGKLTIGDRVPIPATTFNSSQTIGGNIVPITSYTYQNVGIIIGVKPRVHHNKEVTLEMKLEFSAVKGYVTASGGGDQPIIGTRTVETNLRLGDGETNLLAGLMQDTDRSSLSGVAGISDIPVLNQIFGKNRDEVETTDLVISITPHIVRVPNIESVDLVPLWVGTEEQIQLRGIARNALGESPFADGYNPWDEIEQELGLKKEVAPPKPPGTAPGTTSKMSSRPGTTGSGNATAGAAGRGAANRSAAGPSPSPAAPEAPRKPRGSVPAAPTPPVPPSAEPAPVEAPGETGEEPAEEPDDGGEAEEPEADASNEPPKRTAVAQLRLALARTQVAPGDAVPVDVVIAGAENVGMVNFQLRYDKKVLRFVPPAMPGEFMQQGGAAFDLQAVEAAEGGTIVVSASRGGSTGATGTGSLVRLSFIALDQGNAGFGFAAAQVRGPDAQPMPASFRVANLDVKKP